MMKIHRNSNSFYNIRHIKKPSDFFAMDFLFSNKIVL